MFIPATEPKLKRLVSAAMSFPVWLLGMCMSTIGPCFALSLIAPGDSAASTS